MTAEVVQPETVAPVRLENFPIVFFATVMGLSGLALAIMKAEHVLGRSPAIGPAVAVVALAVFVVLAILYAAKAIRYPHAVTEEWHHPVRLSFFPAVSISLILIGTAFRAIHPQAAFALWAFGAGLQIVATLAVVSAWIGQRPFEPKQMTPAWFIPAVGNIIVPIAGVEFGMTEISWFFFSVGLVFWIVLLTLVFNRMVFHDPLTGRLLPTLMILVAPPSVGFIAWTHLTGTLDPFGRILFGAAILFALIVLTQAGKLRRLGFVMSFWAYSFPLAALTIATFTYAEMSNSIVHRNTGLALAVLTTIVICGLLARTGLAIHRREICRPE